MVEDLRIRNYSPRTVQCYVSMVARFTKQFGNLPAQLGAEEMQSPRCLDREEGVVDAVGPGGVRAAVLLQGRACPHDFAVEHIPFAKTKQPLPTVLTSMRCGKSLAR